MRPVPGPMRRRRGDTDEGNPVTRLGDIAQRFELELRGNPDLEIEGLCGISDNRVPLWPRRVLREKCRTGDRRPNKRGTAKDSQRNNCEKSKLQFRLLGGTPVTRGSGITSICILYGLNPERL